MNHLTSTQLQEYADGSANAQIRDDIEIHLQTCAECTAKYKAIRQIDSALRKLPLDDASPDFTQTVMARLKIKESPSIIWSIFKNLAPLFGLIIVVGIIYAALKISGVYDNSGLGESVQATQSVYNQVGNSVSSGISTFNGWLENLFPFLYTKSSYGLTAFLVVLFIIVALLDKFVFMPMMKRRL